MQRLIDNMGQLMEAVMNFIFADFTKRLMGFYGDTLSMAVAPYDGFFSNNIIQGLIWFGQWAAYAAMGFSILFMIIDYMEDLSAGRGIAVSEMVMNVIKGFIFCIIAPELGILSLQVGAELAKSLDLSSQLGQWESRLGGLSLVWLVACLIALIVFVFMSARQYSMMLIHIVTYVLYVPGVVRGDAESMGAWIRQTVAIAVTYLCQYVMFYLGLYFMVSVHGILGLSCWVGMGCVNKVLNKYGMSSGFAGGSQVVSLAAQGLRLAR
ncbi:conjugal transfer protein TrbL family protein [Pygmaiobacter massiliensis]|uniref:conjugal transfer protein TrbL family protein n=1 Tax=Pygmaiobacter massiliensis TaxID=1917873 RepID=UPI000C7C931F|nr:conjugal transfer protein TrbL family protein [Pygmaiobacter massiliensis]MDY4785550.1 DUF6045 family protein [Pygmaiobacter massiliensis]